jgi:hypothetical protein
LAQRTGNWWQLSPSVFVDIAHASTGETAVPTTFFACPRCQTPLPEPINDRLICPTPDCQCQWQVSDNLYDFKEPV